MCHPVANGTTLKFFDGDENGFYPLFSSIFDFFLNGIVIALSVQTFRRNNFLTN
jgi:hypothetical protein